MNEFSVNDKVMHFREGLAVIVDKKEMNGVDYFLVHIEREGGEIVYVPTMSAEKIIRHIISKKEADALISYIIEVKPEYVTNTKQRRDNFKRKLASGDIKDIAYLARQLFFYLHPDLIEVPVKFGPADIDMLKYAHRTLLDELALSYRMSREKIEGYFNEKISRV